jgi:hypothetical protein
MTTRNVIVHYHIFKNAGTSVDHLLKKNFGAQWISFDGDSPGNVFSTQELEQTINREQDKVAFSSHQIVPPLPEIAGTVYPIVFVRDPIDRIKSAYLFEWKKQLGLDQPKGPFKDFVAEKFSRNRTSSVEEFQSLRLSNINREKYKSRQCSDEEIMEQACGFLSSLPFVGVVDEFDRSISLLESYLQPAFPEFRAAQVTANVLQDITVSQALKRQRIQEELGAELYEMVVARNRLDEGLYQHARRCMENLEAGKQHAA